MRSPLLNINRACQTCHHWPESELKARAETIQARTHEMRDTAMDALVELIGDIKAARAAGATDEALGPARQHQRHAQFLLDFVDALREHLDVGRQVLDRLLELCGVPVVLTLGCLLLERVHTLGQLRL